MKERRLYSVVLSPVYYFVARVGSQTCMSSHRRNVRRDVLPDSRLAQEPRGRELVHCRI